MKRPIKNPNRFKVLLALLAEAPGGANAQAGWFDSGKEEIAAGPATHARMVYRDPE
ncbi:MAG: hypothetical protein QG662_472 [Pseudomonadota bacterium]|nr:hypothetical protein [Pseudomonadota bacterium]